ncbi:hypothetical protein [Micromonospora inaquosa]|uniref:Uncharacterized protein n=1 Tax=Micromonospora inaquosa TaxID=2203716 RepID=A0A3N9WHY2_9ACTN|nr:hypothetical protein [Micromonospora inaquosa]RQX00504.1 hypothetical protein DLJ59_21180 [Micromonospora inaquosa]
MTERDEALSELRAGGILNALRWIQESAHARATQDFDPATGHDQAVLGFNAFKLMCDRHDRVFSCQRFALGSPSPEAGEGFDVLVEGLTQSDIDTMPSIAPGSVVRSNLSQSPGWRFGRWRWLLASFEFGEIDRIPWPRKSPTKRKVAAQPHPDQFMLLGVDGTSISDAFATIGDLAGDEVEDDAITLVLAHSLDRHTGLSELYVGRSALNPGGALAWHWKEPLIGGPGGTPGTGLKPGPRQPIAPQTNNVPDAPVRLRSKSAEGPRDQAASGA